MKTVKIMLIAIAVFAVVGGALAFKAKYSMHFCTAELINDQCPEDNICPNTFTGKIGIKGRDTKYCYRLTFKTCDGNTLCTTSDFMTTIED
jgi:hypothetical protein